MVQSCNKIHERLNELMEGLGGCHIALFPAAGMGHLMPFLRLGAILLGHGCCVTLITPRPTLTTAESAYISSFLSTYPQVNNLELHLLPDPHPHPDPDTAHKMDPHFLQFARINRSAHLISPMLSSASPAISAAFFDFLTAPSTVPILTDHCLPLYLVSTSSVKFLPLVAYLPEFSPAPERFINSASEVEFPSLPPMPVASIPSPFFSPDHPFTQTLVAASGALRHAKGILMNTFEEFEKQTLDALNRNMIIPDLPPLLPIGPFRSHRRHQELAPEGDHQEWLDKQPVSSVLYVCFGSKAPMEAAQIQELSKGLVKSGVRFLWVLRTKISLDNGKSAEKAKAKDVKELLEDPVWSKNGKGLVLSSWVDQDEILASPAIGGFVSHCGWNSLTEAMLAGVPVMAWPQNGDQRLNAQVLEETGLGIWVRNWGMGSNDIVKEEEIGNKIGQFMRDEKLRERAQKIGEAARKAVGAGGSSHETITGILRSLVSTD